MNWISWILVGVIGTIVAIFAVNNRDVIELTLWPSPFVIDLPAYLLILGPFVVGVFFGWIWSWLVAGKTRARARRAEYSAKIKQRDLDVLYQKLKVAETAQQEAEDEVETIRLESDHAVKAIAGPEDEKKVSNA